MRATILFGTDDSGYWTVTVEDGHATAMAGKPARPTVTVRTDRSVLTDVVSGRRSGVHAFLDGELTEEEAKERTVTGTRRFARRQDSWFRKDPRITWVGHDDPARVEQALEAVRSSR